jgi:uncharacterized membrane protein
MGARGLMHTEDRARVAAPLDVVFDIASDVERWPEILPHYRWVRVLERHRDWDLVEMAAWRPFGPLNYPTWWVSEMRRLPDEHRVRYRHVRGITRGMDVEWMLRSADGHVEVTVLHDWLGPRWPVVGPLFADAIVGPIFIHAIASRTVAGVKRVAEEWRRG